MGKKDTDTTGTAVSTEPNPNLFYTSGKFVLPNGDTYEGEYCAHRYGLIWREGHGSYYTKDGQIYKGGWKDDRLIEEQPLAITFPSGEEYRGTLLQEKYAGAGTYTMDNKMDLVCEFVDNRPTGNVVMVDINGRIWEGPAGESKALLLLENSFFSNISESRGVGKLKEKTEERKSSEGTSHKSEQSVVINDRELEKMVFTKSTKTAIDMDFSESKWCQRYLRYITMRKMISRKLGAGESLTEEETKWQAKYEKVKRERSEKERQKRLLQKKKYVVDTSLLDAFYSKEFENPPLKVFQPTSDWAPDCYMSQEERNEEEPEVQKSVAEQVKEEAVQAQSQGKKDK